MFKKSQISISEALNTEESECKQINGKEEGGKKINDKKPLSTEFLTPPHPFKDCPAEQESIQSSKTSGHSPPHELDQRYISSEEVKFKQYTVANDDKFDLTLYEFDIFGDRSPGNHQKLKVLSKHHT